MADSQAEELLILVVAKTVSGLLWSPKLVDFNIVA